MADYSKIEKLPEVPDAIREAVNNNNLVVFIGAGVSRIIGCMGWAQFAKNLIDICFTTKKKDKIDTLISFKEKESLAQESDYKKVITICHYILCKQNDFSNIFFEEFNKSLDSINEREKEYDIYKEIFGLRGINLTTNADKHYDKQFSEANRICNVDKFIPSSIDRTKLYQIHGSQDTRSSLVFTVTQYISRYNHSGFKDFLEKVFTDYTVLFLGYGMSEFELLDFLITKFDSSKKSKEIKHYILLPFYSGEENILSFEQSYYNPMGIQVIGYEKDAKGFIQLYDVLKEWNADINKTSTYTLDSYRELENLVSNCIEQDIIDKILQLIKNDKVQENHLFKILATTKHTSSLLKPLKDAGYFNPDKNPSPIEVENQKGYFTIPHWNVLDYLENIARRNKQDPKKETTDTLIDIIQPIIGCIIERKEGTGNYITDWVLTKIIFLLPLDRINAEHFKFIRTALSSGWNTTLIALEIGKSIIPTLLEENSKELLGKLFAIILDYKVIENNSTDKYMSIVDKYWLNSALKQHKGSIAKLCGKKIAALTLDIITRIIKEDKSQFNNIWIPTIEDHPQTSFPDRYECQLVYLVRDIYQESDPRKIYEEIKTLLNQEHPIFNRMALHLINYHYNNLNQFFWEWKDNPLNTLLVKHELYELLKKNCGSFKLGQINKILKWIEQKEYFVSDEQKDDTKLAEKILAYRKKEWLFALLDSKDKKIIDLYKKYNGMNPAGLEHPGFDSWIESGYSTVSPIEETDFITNSNENIADYIISFKEKTERKEPTVDGLARTLRKCVSDNPHKFTDNIKPFFRVQIVYQYSLLLGFSDAWQAKKDLGWKSLFLFINKILGSKTFWTEEYPNKIYHYRNFIISQIADLINNGTQRDDHAFEPVYLPEAEEILLLLVNKAESNFYKMHNIVTSVLNSVKGKIFTAMANYSLRYARLNEKDGWKQTIKNDFTERLNKETENSRDFYVVLGGFLPSLYYLDKKWVINNIDKIFPKENETCWQAAFTGYLFYSSTVYTHLYKLLSQNGHYKKALNINFDDDLIAERVAQHICVAYLNDWEKIEDDNSLISQLINNNDTKQLSTIISFFWMQRDHVTDKIKNKIKPLWKCLFTCFKTNQDKDDFQKLISDISKWLVLVDTIDENVFEWLKLSVKYMGKNNSSFFITYLLIHAEKSPKKVADLFIKMLNQDFYPGYKEEDIKKIVRILNSQNQKENAFKICNLYLNKGFEFVRPILEEIR